MVQTIAKEDLQSGYFYSVCDLCLFTEEKKNLQGDLEIIQTAAEHHIRSK